MDRQARQVNSSAVSNESSVSERKSEERVRILEGAVQIFLEKFERVTDIHSSLDTFKSCFPTLHELKAAVMHRQLLENIRSSVEDEIEATVTGESEDAVEYRKQFEVFDVMLCTTDGSPARRPSGNPAEDIAPEKYKNLEETYKIVKAKQQALLDEVKNLRAQKDKNVEELEKNISEINELTEKHENFRPILEDLTSSQLWNFFHK